MEDRDGVVVYLAGSTYDDVPGTDWRLAQALSRQADVLWVDPPTSLARARGFRLSPVHVERLHKRLLRLRTLGPPGASRAGLREAATWAQDRAIRRLTRTSAIRGVVTAAAGRTLPSGLPGPHLLFVTDDWQEGASLMGIPQARIARLMAANTASADVIAAVSPALAQTLSTKYQRDVTVLANACQLPPVHEAVPHSRNGQPTAALVGQLNERLDLGFLEAVTDRGLAVLVAGPNKVRDLHFNQRLERWLSDEKVTWLGQVAPAEIPAILSSAHVGLTPYRDTSFNRASFPLKTLEYLANGLPVVSSDLPAMRWLDCAHVEIAQDAAQFAELAVALATNPRPDEAPSRVAFAAGHTWDARARQLLNLLHTTCGVLDQGSLPPEERPVT